MKLRSWIGKFMNLSENKAPILVASIAMLSNQADAGWDPIPSLPSPNGGFGCGVAEGKIVILGGSHWETGKKQWLDSIWVMDTTSLKWESHGALPHPLAYPVVGQWEGGLLIAGGSDGKQPRKEVWHLTRSLKLRQIGELKGEAVLAVGDVVGDDLLVLGGCADAAKLDGLHKGGERLHLPDGKRSPLAPAGDAAFGLAAGTAIGNEFFIFGGAKYDAAKQFIGLNSAWMMNGDPTGWRSLKPYPMPIHASATVNLDDHRILIAGGYGGEPADFTAAAYIYDTRRDSYVRTMDLPIAGMVGLVRVGDFVYCLGGEDKSPKHRTAACARVKVAELLKVSPSE
jgi:N-acetylneuraminic acid mutarotase